ncbi:MAG TPA: hypothetical protein PLV25_05960, partial [Opitutales bacterium]|nr:hypothetical protein [Opitutales bacterium]
PILYGSMSSFLALDNYYRAWVITTRLEKQDKETQIAPSQWDADRQWIEKIWTQRLEDAQQDWLACLANLMDPHSSKLIDYFKSSRSQRALRTHPFFKKILIQRAIILNGLSTIQHRQHLFYDCAKKLLTTFKASYTLEEQVAFVRLFSKSTLLYLEALKLPDGSQFPRSLVTECRNLVKVDCSSDKALEMKPNILNPFGQLRDQYIAQNLESTYAITSENELPLIGIYGHSHIPGLKANLKAKGFKVVTELKELEATLISQKQATQTLTAPTDIDQDQENI